MNSDNTALTVFGMTEGQPVIIGVETVTAKIQFYLHLNVPAAQNEDITPTAIYSDRHDEETFLYASVLVGIRSLFLKIDPNQSVDQPDIKWSYHVNQISIREPTSRINFIVHDLQDHALWAGGIIDGQGAIFKFVKESGSLFGLLKLTQINEMEGYSASESQIAVCGTKDATGAQPSSSAIIALDYS